MKRLMMMLCCAMFLVSLFSGCQSSLPRLKDSDFHTDADENSGIDDPDAKLHFSNSLIEKFARKQLGLTDANQPISRGDLLAITHFSYIGNNNTFNLTDLLFFQNLTEIHIEYCEFPSLSILSNLKHLKKISFYECDFNDISPLAQLTQLETMSIYKCGGFQDIGSLKALTNLKVFEIRQTQIKSLDGLEGMKNLIELDASQNAIRDIWPVSELLKLEKLYLLETNVDDIAPLAKLQNLRELNLQFTNYFPNNQESATRKERLLILRKLLPNCTEIQPSGPA